MASLNNTTNGTRAPLVKSTKLSGRRKSRNWNNRKKEDSSQTIDEDEKVGFSRASGNCENGVHQIEESNRESFKKVLKTKAWVSSSELERLRAGPRVDILVGPPGDHFIAVEGASRNLLMHYLGHAKEKLAQGDVNRITILGGTKSMATWIYKYMLAGEKDPEGMQRFEDFDYNNLIELYGHAALLDYNNLTGKIVGCLRYKLLNNYLPDAACIRKIITFIPRLTSLLINAIVTNIVYPRPFDYAAYLAYFKDVTGFLTMLDYAMEKALQRLIAKGCWWYGQPSMSRFIHYLNRTYYYRDERPAELPADRGTIQKSGDARLSEKTKAKSQSALHNANNRSETHLVRAGKPVPNCDQAPKQPNLDREHHNELVPSEIQGRHEGSPHAAIIPSHPQKQKKTCFNCLGKGHIARHCPLPPMEDEIEAPRDDDYPVDTILQAKGEIAAENSTEATDYVLRATHKLSTCYKCGEIGHIARACEKFPGRALLSLGSPHPIRSNTPMDPYHETITCYACGASGHLARHCPNSKKTKWNGSLYISAKDHETLDQDKAEALGDVTNARTNGSQQVLSEGQA